MVRITRRDFLKYCSIAAGALGLSASTMMKVEKVLANTAAPTVVWISGSACTGCTMSLLNSVFYTTADDILLNRLNLAYLDTVMSTAGAYVNGTQWTGSNAIKAAQDVFTGNSAYVLVVEGAIPTGTPPGGSEGDYCRIGRLTGPAGSETAWDNVQAFADNTNCVAVLCVGTCSSFGGIPGANGNVTGSKGVAFSGTAAGGAIVSNTASGKVTSVIVTDPGTGGATSTVTFNPTGASATAITDLDTVTGLTVTAGGSGYTTIPTVTITDNSSSSPAKHAYATAIISGGAVTGFVVTDPGENITSASAVITGGGPSAAGATASVQIGNGKVTRVVVTAGGSYTSAPTVTLDGGAEAYAAIQISKGDVKSRKNTAAKVFNISGCPPHPDWIVGTIAALLDTNLSVMPAVNTNYQPVDFGYKEYQCNAGPCPWRYNNSTSRPDHNARYPEGNSKSLGMNKYAQTDETPGSPTFGNPNVGCLGILGCKGRKTKADCSRRRWNSDVAEQYGVNWCVGSRAGCHGCTEPTFPDKAGKFFTFA